MILEFYFILFCNFCLKWTKTCIEFNHIIQSCIFFLKLLFVLCSRFQNVHLDSGLIPSSSKGLCIKHVPDSILVWKRRIFWWLLTVILYLFNRRLLTVILCLLLLLTLTIYCILKPKHYNNLLNIFKPFTYTNIHSR